MERVTAKYAETHFAEMLDAVERGKEFVITRGGVDVARLLPVDDVPPDPPGER